jgi:TrmH family RNA methyltransferase
VRTLLGRHHSTIRRLRALQRDGALRRAERVLLAEGIHLAQEALASGVAIEHLVFSEPLRRSAEGELLLEEAERRGIPCLETSPAVLDGVQDVRAPQPVLVVARRPEWPEDAGLAVSATGAAPLVGVAWGLQDPGNLGTLLRTAHAAGATACHVCGESVDPYHPRAVRASTGAIFRLPVLASEFAPLRARLARRGLRVYAADAGAAASYEECDLEVPVAVVFGREGEGLPRELLDAVDATVRIPLVAGAESLSVAAAAAVLFFEAARQRRAASRDSLR